MFDAPLQHDYEAGVEVRSPFSTEAMEEVDGRLAVTDVGSNGPRYVKFWIDKFSNSPMEEQATYHPTEEHAAARDPQQSPVSIPMLPVFSERNAESRVPRTPERREGLTPGNTTGPGSPGFGAGASAAQRDAPRVAGLTLRLETQQHTNHQPRS